MVETLAQLFINTVKTHPKDDLMLYKKEDAYVPISTQDFEKKVKFLSLGLRELGLNPGDKLIILSENRPEWVITDLAAQCVGAATVPIYTSLVPEQIRYIVDNSDAKFVVYSCSELRHKVEAVKNQLPKVARYITFEPESSSGEITFDEVIEKGEKTYGDSPGLFDEMASTVSPDDVASIIYT